MAEKFEVRVIDLNDLAGVKADEAVAKSGLNIRTLPDGKYIMGIDKMEGRALPSDAKTDADRQFVNITASDPDTKRKVFFDASWEPSENAQDKMGVLYSQIELALGMSGADVLDVLTAASDSKFEFTLVETCRVAVEELPEDNQTYYLNTKGLAASTQVTVYIKAEETELREFLAMNGHRIRNYVKSIGPVPE